MNEGLGELKCRRHFVLSTCRRTAIKSAYFPLPQQKYAFSSLSYFPLPLLFIMKFIEIMTN